jgi:glycosyltransferase involved in cell wall biosynthesis
VSTTSADAHVVIPCFNEEHRLDIGQLAELLEVADVQLVLVDDGSGDATRSVLEAFAAAHPGRVSVLPLGRNRGKAEAVRAGLRQAVDSGATWTGYLDADFATPASELLRLLEVARAEPDAVAVLGSRVALLGREIVRSRGRHYVGRIFATLASIALQAQVYDTQCGAKLFRVTPSLDEATAERFRSRWAFDVELLARLNRLTPGGPPRVIEEPLLVWRDIGGSKLSMPASARALLDLARIGRVVRRPPPRTGG